MKRIQLFEFEDQTWFPDWMRSSLTRLIKVFLKMMGFTKPAASLVKSKMKEVGTKKLVDLGSGAGGVMLDVYQEIKKDEEFSDVQFTLTDLYPNQSAVNQINSSDDPNISYLSKPVDATEISTAPEGLKTMFNAFHHLSPDKAKSVLQSCVKNQTPILIYEIADNKLPLLLWWLLLPLSLVILTVMVLFMTPFVKSLTFKQVVFTYIIPIIPIAYAWDGQASYVRVYALKDYKELLKDVNLSNYSFEIELLKSRTKDKAPGYYVFGKPLKSA